MEFFQELPISMITLIVFGVLLLLLATGMWIALALGLTGILAITVFTRFDASQIASLQTWNRSSLFILTALPMFILMGELLVHTRLSRWLFDGLAPWMVWLPGRLLHTNVVGCAFFAGISGSSTATTLTIGRVTYTHLKQRGYDERLAVGSLAGAGTLGLLIPPSVIPIIYAAVVGESVGQLFLAGVFPGLLVAGLFSLWIGIRAKMTPEVVPPEVERYTWEDRWRGLILMSPVLGLMFLMLGSIYSGIATPTEAAGMGVAAAIFLGIVTRSLSFGEFINALLATCRTTSFIMLVIVGATFLGVAAAYVKLPGTIANEVALLTDNVYLVLLMLGIVYVILGMFLDPNSVILLTLPVIIPTIDALGINRIWFEVFLVLMVEMANVTPPVGFNLYVIQAMSGHSIKTIAVASTPFVILLAVAAVIITIFPDIALWLPRTQYS